MASDQQEDRDRRAELETGLRAVFKQSLKGYQLRHDLDNTFIPHTPESYKLTIEICIAVADAVKDLYNMSLVATHIGAYQPILRTTYQDFNTASVIVALEYHLDDLDHFLTELEKRVWSEYNDGFSESLEKKISD